MEKLKAKFVPATVFCLAVLILVFQFGCQVTQTRVNSPPSLLTTTTPTPQVVVPKVEPKSETYAGNVAVNSARRDDSKQNEEAAMDIDFEIKGVGIGTSETEVLQKLGKPLQSKKTTVDEVCGGDFQKTLHYSGLTFGLSSDDEGRNYSVISVDVSSPKWMEESLFKLGADAKDVETAFDEPNLFNQPNSKETDKGQTIFYYTLRRHEGGAKLYFQNNKLTRISWTLDFC